MQHEAACHTNPAARRLPGRDDDPLRRCRGRIRPQREDDGVAGPAGQGGQDHVQLIGTVNQGEPAERPQPGEAGLEPRRQIELHQMGGPAGGGLWRRRCTLRDGRAGWSSRGRTVGRPARPAAPSGHLPPVAAEWRCRWRRNSAGRSPEAPRRAPGRPRCSPERVRRDRARRRPCRCRRRARSRRIRPRPRRRAARGRSRFDSRAVAG